MGRVPRTGGAAGTAASTTTEKAADPSARGTAGERTGPVRDPLLRPWVAGDGRAQRNAAEARVAGRCARATPVPAGARAPRLRRASRRRAAAAAAAPAW